MFRCTGDPDSAVWLLGDSNPKSERAEPENADSTYCLKPLDSRHPTRHNIWTPILDVIQRHGFAADRIRFNDSALYTRNAVGNPDHKRDNDRRGREIAELRGLVVKHRPPLIVTFGAFAYEFALHSLAGVDDRPQRWTVWKVRVLARQFEKAIATLTGPEADISLESTRVIPLLHAIGARQFRYCHREFSGGRGNYFEYVGQMIAGVLIGHRAHPRIARLWT